MKEKKPQTAKKSDKKRRRQFLEIYSSAEKGYLVENLSLLLSSGMTISQSLEAIKVELRSQGLRITVDYVIEDIVNGLPLWKAVENAKIFPAHMVSLIRIGEESGKLSQNLQVISIEQQKEREFSSKIASAMLYPVFVFVLTLIIGIGVSWFILPRLATVFYSLKVKLPLITKILIDFGAFLGQYGAIVVPIIVIFTIVFLYFCFLFPKTKFIGQAIIFFFPPIRKLIQEVQIARLGYILGTLLSAGLPIVDSLRSLASATDFLMYKKLYMQLAEAIDEGNSVEKSFHLIKNSRQLIPTPIQQLIISGEKSSALAKTLLNIGAIFEGRTDISTKNLSVILEPILLVIVWLGVVAVALAVILPLYSLIGGLNAGGQ